MSAALFTEALTPITVLPGDALIYGPGTMREPHWKWSIKPSASYILKVEDASDGAPQAILRVFIRLLKSDMRTFRAVGIGGVWTRPESRGKGYATALLKATMFKLREEQPSADLVIMHSSPRSLYNRFGFMEIADDLLANALHGDIHIAPGNWRVEPEEHF